MVTYSPNIPITAYIDYINANNIKAVEISSVELEKDLSFLSLCKDLEALYIRGSGILESFIDLYQLPKLKCLDIQLQSAPIDFSMLPSLEYYTSSGKAHKKNIGIETCLKLIELQCDTNWKDFNCLQNLKSLKQIRGTFPNLVSLQGIEKMELEQLVLLSKKDIQTLMPLHNSATTLKFLFMETVSCPPDFLTSIIHFKKLVTLSIKFKAFPTAFLPLLPSFQYLEDLFICITQSLSEKDLDYISQIPMLKKLVITGSGSLPSLNFTKNLPTSLKQIEIMCLVEDGNMLPYLDLSDKVWISDFRNFPHYNYKWVQIAKAHRRKPETDTTPT